MTDAQSSSVSQALLMLERAVESAFVLTAVGVVTELSLDRKRGSVVSWEGKALVGRARTPQTLCLRSTHAPDDTVDRCIKQRRAIAGVLYSDHERGLVITTAQANSASGPLGDDVENRAVGDLWDVIWRTLSPAVGDHLEFLVVPVGCLPGCDPLPSTLSLRVRRKRNRPASSTLRRSAEIIERQANGDRTMAALFDSLMDGSVESGGGRPEGRLQRLRLSHYCDEVERFAFLRYQPIVHLAQEPGSIAVEFCEGLLRHQVSDGAVYAGWAIDAARLWSDLRLALDSFVTQRALDDLAGVPGCAVSVNVHWPTVASKDFAAAVTKRLGAEDGILPSRLIFELSEAGVPDRLDDAIHDDLLRCTFAMDDFPNRESGQRTAVDLGNRFTILKVDGFGFGKQVADLNLQSAKLAAKAAGGTCIIVQEWVNSRVNLRIVVQERVKHIQFREFDGSPSVEWESPRRDLPGPLRTALAKQYRAIESPRPQGRRGERG